MSTFKQQTGKSIQRAFRSFHRRNPKVYKLIRREVNKAIKAGKKKFSIKQIIGYIRWEIFLKTDEQLSIFDVEGNEQKFKINDAYSSRYARELIKHYPHYRKYFDIKKLRAK